MTNFRGKIISFLLVALSSLFAIATLEVIFRVYMSASDQVVYMMSSPSFVRSPEGGVRYSPNTAIRSVASDRSGIVYEALFHTNNLGFVDTVDYERDDSRPRIALLGDSFTAGYHGGTPWVDLVRGTLGSTTSVFNLGISATGIRDFEPRLSHFATSVGVDEIYVLVISNDFYRRPWYPISNSNGLWLCSVDEGQNECVSAKPPTFYDVELHSSTDEVLSSAAAIRANRPTQSQGSRIYGLLKSLFWRLRAPDQLADQDVQSSLQAVLRIVNQYGRDRVTVVHLPEKHEVTRQRYDLDLLEFASDNGINYIQMQEICPLNRSMYFVRDAHPNAEGYLHIANCMVRIIRDRSISA